jgi:hypothetical protein
VFGPNRKNIGNGKIFIFRIYEEFRICIGWSNISGSEMAF